MYRTKLRKSAYKYIDIMKGGVFTERDIINLRGRLNSSSSLTEEEKSCLRGAFYDLMPEDGYKITARQAEKGIKYLKDNTWKKNNTLRKNNIFGFKELSVLNNFKEFRLVDLYNLSTNYYDNFVPVYETISKHGNSFKYTGVCYSNIKIL